MKNRRGAPRGAANRHLPDSAALLALARQPSVIAHEVASPLTASIAGRVGDVLRVAVRDRGVGIASDLLERIFEPGFTTKGIGEGSGMGLAVVRDLAQNVFGGAVEVVSEPGVGSVFTVVLPIPPQRG